MDKVIDFEEVDKEPLIGRFIKNDVDNIYKLVNDGNIESLNAALNELHNKLITHCNTEKIILKNYFFNDSAKKYFSQFLQYFFYSILKMEIDLLYKKELLNNIFINYKDNFYYQFIFNGQKKTALWLDTSTGDTVLTAVSQRGDSEILDKLLSHLKDLFTVESESDAVPSELEQYLFHENKLGRSALSLIWLRQELTMEKSLFNFASLYYKDSKTFQKFLFQTDATENTALMRSVERKLMRVFYVIVDNLKRIFLEKKSSGFKKLLLHSNEQGETVLLKMIQIENIPQLEYLLNEALFTFDNTRSFLLFDSQPQKTPFIEAIKVRNKKIIDTLVTFITENSVISVHDLLSQQDTEGYTVLMRAIELNYREGFNYFLNILLNSHWILSGYVYEPILNILYLKQQPFVAAGSRPSFSQSELNVFQIAAKMSNWEILEDLIDTVELVSSGYVQVTKNELNYVDENGINVLTKLFREERESRTSGRRMSTRERTDRYRRLRLARILAKLGQRPERNIVPGWISVDRQNSAESQSLADRIINFFSIFCRSGSSGSSGSGKKRSLGSHCFFSEEDYKVSIPEKLLQRYKEALISILAILKQTNLDSIEQIRIIRNTQLPSERENKLLEKFSQVITRYYNSHAATILASLKKNVAENLEAAFAENKPYILLDNQKDLLLLKNNKIFSASLLNPVKIFSLDPTITHEALKIWLDTYFGSTYTLHPFDAELVLNYPDVLGELGYPIISDTTLLAQTYGNVKNEIIRELFLLDGKPIEISKFTEVDFFVVDKSKISFRADRFHEIFFKLNLAEQVFLKEFIAAHETPVANYPQLSSAENEYLRSYGNKLLDLTVGLKSITPISLFNVAIDAHEEVLLQETDLSIKKKNEIMSELRALKTRLDIPGPGVHTKAALQLLVFLFPSMVRALANKDPLELATPIGLIAVDTALREILIRFVNHPQASQIFVGELASKILGIAGQTVEKVPVVGSALALYGLIQSGKALSSTTHHDPNRSYYAHLLVNNLVTVGMIGAEVVTSLPFWPVLGLFTALTVDQLVTEGGRIHDVELHLQDDYRHPLLRFYRKLELGLSIVEADIQMILEQRQLFDSFLNYLDKVRNIKGADALVAVFLPHVRRVSILKAVQGSRHQPGCGGSFSANKESIVYPQSPFCTTYHLLIREKGNYSYELGELKTFCEKLDPFAIEHTSNYTLLVGSQSIDCSLGQSKTKNAVAKTSANNAAGILVNNRYRGSNVSTDYRLFLPIDPFLVGKYNVKLLKKTESEHRAANEGLDEWLPCANDAVSCITHIRVAVTRLYDRAASNSTVQTQININDDSLREATNSSGVRTIEYLLAVTNNVRIASNQIPEKIFAFFKNQHYLKLENNWIKSANNFAASLVGTKKLTLEFTDKAWLEGHYQVPSDQMLVINQLKGKNEERPVVLDVTQSDSFTVNLGQYTELRDKAVNISLQAKFNTSFLEVYRHHNANTFYHFLIPINKIKVIYSKNPEQLFFYMPRPEAKESRLFKIKISASNAQIFNFSGNYEYNNNIYFSRITMRRRVIATWECNLEINASAANDTELFDLQAFKAQNFNKVSILVGNSLVYKKIHYLFYQSESSPYINGKFITYRLLGTKDGWLLILKHVAANEKTKCFIGENTKEVIIDKIRYVLSPGLASMFAVGTLDNSPIEGDNLIASIKIPCCFDLCNVQTLQNDTYKIDDIAFKNLPLNAKIYFSDQVLPFSYLKYRFELNQVEAVSTPITMKLIDGRQFLEMQPATERLVKRSRDSYVNSFFVGTMALAASVVGGAIFMLKKRFKRSPLSVSAAVSIPLIETPKASALPHEAEFIPDLLEQNLVNLPKFKLFKGIETLKSIPSNKYPSKALSSVEYTSDLNTQLVLGRYLLYYFNKYSNSAVVKNKKSKETKQLIKDKNYFFTTANNKEYLYSQANNDTNAQVVTYSNLLS